MTATTFMGSGVSESHERRRFQFCVSLRGVVSCKGAASSLVPRVSLSSSSSVSVCLRRSARWLAQGVGYLFDVLHRESGNHRGVRVLSVCGTFYSAR